MFFAASVWAEAGAGRLEPVATLSLYKPDTGLTEPSGLAVDPSGTAFWIVSDNTEVIFRLAFDGALDRFTGVDPRLTDLEGITVDVRHNRLLAVSERRSSILSVDLRPPHRIAEFPLKDLAAQPHARKLLSDRQNGLEGIAVDPNSGLVYVLKEAKPRLLITLSPTLDKLIAIKALDGLFKGSPASEVDASGLALDTHRGGLWIVSDTGKSAHFLPFDEGQVKFFELTYRAEGSTYRLDNPEGIALSANGASLYVLSDNGRKSRLVQYAIPKFD
ncbi:SdiA-regulated domain-containing protein [Aestuariivita boseongensis]|uniref:SdiA-regulated domain-containing protein n=1 Tax=Aestuariivita boseongensis TaxID=1470562 RepID=UPI00068258F0|nr:SdiA-regulated domain-containing protein [Aestuariivita boseongensis]